MGETQEICNILAVDDEDYTLELYRDVLENRVETQSNTKMVYRLYTATQGDQALELFKRESQNSRFCVVFLDINMPPGPDGVWVAQQIREIDKEVNIVLVTGFAGLDLEEISSKIPPLDKLLYLQKPFHIQEILQLASALSAKWFAERRSKEVTEYLEKMVESRTKELQREMGQKEEARKALERSEKNLRSMIQSNPDPMFIISHDGQVKYANPSFMATFAEAGGRVNLPPEVIQRAIDPSSLERVSEIHTTSPQNNDLLFEMILSPTEWEGKPALLASLRDITQRKRMEERLREGLLAVRSALVETIKAMAYLVETRDPYTAGHQQRVAALAREIALELQVDEDRTEGLYLAGIVHDIGKISIPAEILTKPSKLTEIELKLMQGHPQTGYEILKQIPFPWPIARIVLEHHERLDGSGYPLGKSDGEILMESCILAVADVVEAMASHRPYRPALGIEPALMEVESKKGTKFDPDAVEACIKVVREGRIKLL